MFETKTLLEYWNPLLERCGFLLDDNSVIELENLAADRAKDFAFHNDNFKKYENAIATWHTHPSGDPNLSLADYKAFLNQPNLFHYIVGDGIVWMFYARDNKVFLYEDPDL